MKTILKIIIAFGLALNINAQSIERTSYKINVNGKTENGLKLDKKLVISKGLLLDVSPQFGNLFMTRFEAKKAKINLKDFYNDYDLGLKMCFSYSLKKQLHLKALYKIGLLKFTEPDCMKSKGYVVQLSLDYSF
jgi:hypothetical protein